MSILVVEAVTRRYGAVVAVDGVSLRLELGSRTAVVGPSGSGKSTLLRLLAGFEVADAGRITLGGDVLADGRVAVPAHRRGVGIVAQDGALFPHLSVGENVGFGLPRHLPGREAQVRGLMELVGLDPVMATRRPDQLSGGQQQRVALARAMARKPRLMLLDEPFSALDAALRASTRRAVARVLTEAGITALLVTHDQEEALSFADQVAVMREGRLMQVGPPAELYAHPVDETTAILLGDALIMPAMIRGGWATCALGSAEAAGPDGTATIMLRPEQLLVEVGAGDMSGCQAEILVADYGGAACYYTMRILSGGCCETLTIRQSGFMSLPVGMIVGISIRGPAHVLSTRSMHHGGAAITAPMPPASE